MTGDKTLTVFLAALAIALLVVGQSDPAIEQLTQMVENW